MKVFITTIATLLASTAFAATTTADCAKAYKKCKNDVANMFDQKPCKKKRASCEAEVASFQAQAVQNTTKNKMLTGTVDAEPTTGIDNFGEQKQVTAKEAAQQRMRTRFNSKGTVEAKPVDKKDDGINNF